MLIQTLLNEATVSSNPKKDTKTDRKDFTHIAPAFHDESHNRYANVAKYIKILGHAEHLADVDVSISIGSKEVKIAITAWGNKVTKMDAKEEKSLRERLNSFWTKVGKYLESISDRKTVFGRYVNHAEKERIPLTTKALLKYITERYVESRHGFSSYQPMEFAIENSTAPRQEAHDYDAILKDVKKSNPNINK